VGECQTLVSSAQSAASLAEYWNGLAQDASASAGSSTSSASNAAIAAAASAGEAASSAGDAYVSAGVASSAASAAAASAAVFVPFTGGAVTSPITNSTATYDTEMSGELFGVQLSADHTQSSYLAYDGLRVGNGTSNTAVRADTFTMTDVVNSATTTIYPGSFNFINSSAQFLSEGNDIAFISATNSGTSAIIGVYDDAQGGTFAAIKGSQRTIVNGNGITFPDATVQTSAAFVPGSGDLNLQGYSITDANFSSPAGQVSAQNVTMSAGGVLTFGDNTVQSTAASSGATNNNQLATNVNNYTTAATLIAPVDGNAIAVCQGGCYAVYLGDSSAGWQIGQQVLIVNRSGSAIPIQNYGASSNVSYNGGYILGVNGVCAAVYVDTNLWVISGNLTT